MSVKIWLQNRRTKQAESFEHILTKSDLPNEINELVQETINSSELKHYFADTKEFLNYLANQANKQFDSNLQKSYVASLVQKHLHGISVKLAHLSAKDLNKAATQKDWGKILRSHNEEGSLHVNVKPYLEAHPAPKEYAEMLSSEKAIGGSKDPGGVSAKLMHHIGNTGYMAKPFHKKVEGSAASLGSNPILGWATMTNKALYDAGNISHLNEKVHAHEHDGIPMTVHEFSPNMAESGLAAGSQKRNVDPLHIQQIATMDYLSNNLDRHGGNILIGDHAQEGYHPILAIDHERSFQYHKPLAEIYSNNGRTIDTPHDYLDMIASHVRHDFHGWHDLRNWWGSNSQNIKDSFLKHVQNIKNDKLRQHVTNNFVARFNSMNNWSDHLNNESNAGSDRLVHSPDSLFEIPKAAIVKHPNTKLTSNTIKNIIHGHNPIDSFNIFANEVNSRKKTLSLDQQAVIRNHINAIIKEMTPDQIAQSLEHIAGNPNFNTKMAKKYAPIRNLILQHLNAYRDKKDHLMSAVQYIDALPDKDKEILGEWSSKFKHYLGGNR